MISGDEIGRANAFRFEKHRTRFIATRAMLRGLLARYLEDRPEQIEFVAGEFGKPYLANRALQFNVSHSGSIIAIAIAHDEVGIDIEQLDRKCDVERLARECFEPREAGQLLALPAGERVAAFLKLWTKTEAFCKASGCGIGQGLRQRPDNRWTIVELDAPDGYAASLAFVGHGYNIECFDYLP